MTPSPEPESSSAGRLDLAIESILDELRNGKCPSLEDLIARYPDCASDIREVFPALLMVEQIKQESLSRQGTANTYIFTGTTNPPSSSVDHDFSIDEDSLVSPRFEFMRPLDQGGLGIVSVALDKSLNREVALKEIRDDRSDDPVLRQKFLLEAQLTGGLEHPGIIPIYGLGKSANGKPYYAMRLIKGNNLHLHIKNFHERVKQGKSEFAGQSLRRILRRFMDVCEAISYAHSRGVLHRDLKPSNIMLGPYGETLVVDWGLAKAMGISSAPDSKQTVDHSFAAQPETPLKPSGSKTDETQNGSIVGTPAYAPPEQLAGRLEMITVRSDVYGLGAILYEILCGQAPAAGSLLDVIRKITTGKVTPARKINPSVPKSLDAICLKAIALAPEDRFESANELRSEVERWLDDAPVKSFPDPLWVQCRRWVRKHPSLASTISVAAMMSILGTVIFTLVVSRNNAILASLNRVLDGKNTELLSSNQELAALNTQLDSTNSDLNDSVQREKQAKEIAQQQSELALSTLNAVVIDIQQGLKTVPGGANIRRRLLATSLAKLEKVATDVVSQSSGDRSTLKALLELGDVVLQFGTDSSTPLPDRVTTTKIATNEGKSAAKIAQSVFLRAHEIATSLDKETSDKEASGIELAKLDLLATGLALGNLTMRLGDSENASTYFLQCLAVCEKLLEKSPDNFQFQQKKAYFSLRYAEFLTKTGRLEDSRRLFQSALSDYRHLLELQPEHHGVEGGLCIVLEYLGESYGTDGQLLLAQEALAECLNRRENRYKAMPANTTLRRDLIIALGKYGENQLKLGVLPDAISTADRTLALHREAIEQDPLDILAQADLANTLDRRAGLASRQGDSDEAVQFLTDSMEIRKRLTARDPMDSIRKRDLSVTYDNLGKVETKRGNASRALELTRDSLTIARELSASDPGNTMKQRDVALSLISIGILLLQQGKTVETMELYQESLQIMQQLAESDPENPSKHRDWLIGISRVANVHAAEKRFDQALASYQQGLVLARQHSEKKPEVLELKRDLSIWLELTADIHKQLGKPGNSIGLFEECLSIREGLLNASPNDARSQSDVASALDNVGTNLGELDRVEESVNNLSRAIDLTTSLAKNDPNNLGIQRELAVAKMHLGITRRLQGNSAEAIRELAEGQSICESLLKADPSSLDWTKDWIEVTKLLANLQLAIGMPDQAKLQFNACTAVLNKLIQDNIDTEWAAKELESANTALTQLPQQVFQ